MLIPTTTNTKTISDMRLRPLSLLNNISRNGGINYIFHRSTPKAVLLSITDFENMMNIIEDYNDSLLAKKFESEDKNNVEWLTPKQVDV